jgi:FKBP-type peptidyl-prolyl cis-trans isomerase
MKKHILIFAALFAIAINASAQSNYNYQRTAKGLLYRIVTPHPAEPRLKLNDVITFQVIQKTEKDSILFSTYAVGHPVKIQIQPSQNIGDLMDLFPLLSVKDSVVARVPADSIFKEHEQERPPFLPKGSNIVFVLKIEKAQTLNEAIAEKNAALEKMKSEEAAKASKYIADHKLAVQSTASGLKYIITHPTTKRKPMPGDTLLVNYTGRNLDGKVFESSIESEAIASGTHQPGRPYTPIKVVVGQGQVIKGWDEGLLLLTEGSKAQFIIPSDLGYGSQGSGDIAPFSTLVFDIELVKVTRVKYAEAKPAATKAPVKHTTTTTSAKKKKS